MNTWNKLSRIAYYTGFFLVFFLLAAFSGVWAAGGLVLEKTPDEVFLSGGVEGLFRTESWPVHLNEGMNQFSWEMPQRVNPKSVFVRVEGGTLQGIEIPRDGNQATINVFAPEERMGLILLSFPLPEVAVNFRYQLFWKEDADVPEVFLFGELNNLASSPLPPTELRLAGKTVIVDAEARGVQRFSLGSLPVVSGERYVRSLPDQRGERRSRVIWTVTIPFNVVFPARVECFSKGPSGAVFMGETDFAGTRTTMEIDLGTDTEITVNEHLLKQEKTDRVVSRHGYEELYHTEETKRYTIANRGEEMVTVEVVDTLRRGYELISLSVDPFKVDSTSLVFRLELDPGEEQEVTVDVRGRFFTSGFVF